MTHATPEQFMAATPTMTGSNSAWGQRYAGEIRQIIAHAAENAPRSLQTRLGPSELGAVCDRQVVGKLLSVARTNHVADPWPAIVGTAIHAWLADTFGNENARYGYTRFLTELAVAPTPEHPGHTDLYDAREQAVVDWKALGPTSLAKIRSGTPPRHYHVQLLLYGLGCLALGLPVRRVVIAALPRTASTLDSMFIWDHPFGGPDDAALLEEVLRVTEVRKQVAAEIRKGGLTLEQVPITPDDDACFRPSLLLPSLQAAELL